MPYTYLIGWSEHKTFYYGCRFSKKCHPDDLWNGYYTSSRYVQEFRKMHGEPDIIQIRKISDCIDIIRKWETKVLKRMKVIHSDKWLNRTDNISISLSSSVYKHTEEIKNNKSKARFGKKHSDETKEKIRKGNFGRKNEYAIGVKRPDLSLNMKGSNNPNAKETFYNGKIYSTMNEMSEKLGISLYKTRKLLKENSFEL